MDKDLQGKTALVTGAASGIGRAVALLYGQHGANVMVSDIDAEQGRQVVAELTAAGANTRFFRADVGDPAQCQQWCRQPWPPSARSTWPATTPASPAS